MRPSILKLTGSSNFLLDNVTFNTGINPERPLQPGNNGGLNRYFALDIQECQNFTVKNCNFTGNGSGSYFRQLTCDYFTVESCRVYDGIAKTAPDGFDDQVQGITALACTNFTYSNCTSGNLLTWDNRSSSGDLQNTYQNINTRSFSFSGSTNFTVVGCHAYMSSQGFDITGSGTNTQFVVSSCTADTVEAVGFKAANGPHQGIFDSCVAKNAGLYSFVVSSSSNLNDHDSARYITFNNCKAIDTGYISGTDWRGLGARTDAFSALAGTTSDTEVLPLRCSFSNCEVWQENSVVDNAYFTNITIPDITADEGSTGAYANTPRGMVTHNCFTGGRNKTNIKAQFTGHIGPVSTSLALTQDVPITFSSGQGWFDIPWDSEVYDNHNLHNSSEAPERLYVRESGTYMINATIAVSERPDNISLRLLQNGELMPGGPYASMAGIDQGIPTILPLTWTGYISCGTKPKNSNSRILGHYLPVDHFCQHSFRTKFVFN